MEVWHRVTQYDALWMTLITDHGSGSSCVMGDMGDADNGVTQVIIITILSVTGHQCWSLIVLINIVTHVLITNIRLHQSCIPHIQQQSDTRRHWHWYKETEVNKVQSWTEQWNAFQWFCKKNWKVGFWLFKSLTQRNPATRQNLSILQYLTLRRLWSFHFSFKSVIQGSDRIRPDYNQPHLQLLKTRSLTSEKNSCYQQNILFLQVSTVF